MCNCSQSKNQTNKQVIEHIAEKHGAKAHLLGLSEVGVGFFQVPAPEIGILESRLVKVEGITYEETMKRGHNCESFAFFPQSMIEANSIGHCETSSCFGGCRGLYCFCYPGLFCGVAA